MRSSSRAVGRRAVPGGSAGSIAAPASVSAQGGYPSRTVRYVNPFPTGSAREVRARRMHDGPGRHREPRHLTKLYAKLPFNPCTRFTSSAGPANDAASQRRAVQDHGPGRHAAWRYRGAAPKRCQATYDLLPSRQPSAAPWSRDPHRCRDQPGFDIVSWTTLTGPAKLGATQVRRPCATPWWQTPADTLAYRSSEEAQLAPIIKKSGAR